MSEISVYKSPVKNVIPLKSVTLNDIYTVIKSDKYKFITDKLRSLSTKSEKDLCKQTELDYVTFSGTFKTRSNDLVINRSNYFCIDIDHLGYSEEIESMKSKLMRSYIPALIFISPSGDGLKVVYKIDIEKGTHDSYFQAFKEFFKTEYDITIDSSCRDISRACFLCYDNKCFKSEEPSILDDNFINSYKPIVINITYTQYEGTDRPGDIYNASSESIYDMKDILKQNGWTNIDGYKWCRPGKTGAVSATLGKIAPNIFYVFTSSALPFEPNKAYTPFQVLALLKFNGDFKEAAKSVAPNDVKQIQSVVKATLEITEIERILSCARIDTTKPISKPPTILSIKEYSGTTSKVVRLFTLGNFSCIIGKAKSRKTFLQSMLTAALLGTDQSGRFISEMPSNKQNILYFDTEQGEFDSYNVISRVERMSGNHTNLKGFSLRQFSPNERCQIIEYAFEKWGNETGFCVIDGVADLANAINDEIEATRVSTLLLRLTKVYNCHISTIIHQNKNDNFATGHLGSSIMKKAEILISVSKSKTENGVSEVSCDLNRGIDFDPFEMIIDDTGIPYVRNIVNRVKYEPSFNNIVIEPPLAMRKDNDFQGNLIYDNEPPF